MNEEKNSYVKSEEYDNHSNFIKNSRERTEYNIKVEEKNTTSVDNAEESKAEKLTLICFIIIIIKRIGLEFLSRFSFIYYLDIILIAKLLMIVIVSYVVIIVNKIKYPNNKKIKIFFWILTILLIMQIVLTMFTILGLGIAFYGINGW